MKIVKNEFALSDSKLISEIIIINDSYEKEDNCRNSNKLKKQLDTKFGIIVGRYYNNVLNSIAYNNNIDKDMANSFVSEAFMVLYENIISRKYKEEGKISGYVHRIAKWKFLKFYEIDKNNQEYEEKFDSHFDDLDKEIFENKEEENDYVNISQKLIKELSKECQELIYAQYSLSKISDETYYEENKYQYSSKAAIRKKRYKCMSKLKKLFNEEI